MLAEGEAALSKLKEAAGFVSALRGSGLDAESLGPLEEQVRIFSPFHSKHHAYQLFSWQTPASTTRMDDRINVLGNMH